MNRPKYPSLADMRAADRSDFFSRKTRKQFGDQKYHAYKGHLIIRARVEHSDRSTSTRFAIHEFRPNDPDDCKMFPIGAGESIGNNLDACKEYIRKRIENKTSIWARKD